MSNGIAKETNAPIPLPFLFHRQSTGLSNVTFATWCLGPASSEFIIAGVQSLFSIKDIIGIRRFCVDLLRRVNSILGIGRIELSLVTEHFFDL